MMAHDDHELYGSVERIRTSDSVVARIQELILASKLRPGDALPSERDLAAILSVGRNALREALGVLSQRGLLDVVPGRGTFVAELSSGPMRDSLELLLRFRRVGLVELCDARLLIEPELAGFAAARIDEADTVSLTAAFEALKRSNEDAELHVEADLAFHREIARIAQHAVYQAIVDAVREPVTRSMMFGTIIPRAIGHSDAQHEAIWRTILAKDADGARLAMREHLEYVRTYVVDHEIRIAESPTGGRRE